MTIGSLTPRMLFGFFALLFSLPKLMRWFRGYITNPILLMFLAFLAYLAVCAVRGYLADNKMSVLLNDVKGFAWLLLVPVFIAAVDTRARFSKLLSCILVGAVIQAGIALYINTVCSTVSEGIMIFYHPIYNTQLGTVGNISGKIYRVFMRSCPYMVIACGIAFFRQVQAEKIRLRYVAAIGVCLCGILMSFTRSLYGCTAVVALCAIVAVVWFYRSKWKKMLKFGVITAVVTFCMVFAMEFMFSASYFNFALSRTIGTEPKQSLAVSLRNTWECYKFEVMNGEQTPGKDLTEELEQNQREELVEQQDYIDVTEESDNLRQVTMSELGALIRVNPVFGNGLGAFAPSRDTGKNLPNDGLDEYFYLDVLARMGMVGLVLYMLPFAYLMVICLKERRKLAAFPGGVAIICGTFGFWAITWFNPWMNAVLGITGYALCCTVPQVIRTDR